MIKPRFRRFGQFLDAFRREFTPEKHTKISPNILQIQHSADSHEFSPLQFFTSFSSLISVGVSDGKTFIGNLLFVGCYISYRGSGS